MRSGTALAATLAVALAAAAAAGGAAQDRPAGAAAPAPSRKARGDAPPPAITRPVPFDTPEADAILTAREVVPADHPLRQRVDRWPVHPDSRAVVASIGREKPLRYNPDMAFVLVPPDQPRVEVRLVDYPGESDPGPFPVPDETPVEGWPVFFQRAGKALTLAEAQRRPETYEGDRHAIVVDPTNRRLYEFFTFGRTADGAWAAGQASVFDLASAAPRPEGWTSADAAGLPIFPTVVRHDEIARGRIDHALRVTVTRTRRAYVFPARHFASRLDDPDLPRMGERLRLRADFDTRGFSPPVRTILEALQRHGMIVADNGIDWAVSVAPDPRIPEMHDELRRIKGADFEVVVAPEAAPRGRRPRGR